MRPFVMLFAAFALILAPGPGPGAYAAGMDTRTVISAHQESGGCAPARMPHDQTDKHAADGCGKMQCCLGATCVSAGLPGTAAGATPMPGTALSLSAATAPLVGRDVAPPFDPPRPFA